MVFDGLDQRERAAWRASPRRVDEFVEVVDGDLDQTGRVLVDRGEEQRFLVREVVVGERARDAGVAGDVGHRRRPEPVAGEPVDRGAQNGLPGLRALGHVDKNIRIEGLIQSLNSYTFASMAETAVQTSNPDLQIPTRRMNFDEAIKTVPKHFGKDGDLSPATSPPALSSVFPDGEDFFVKSVRHYRDQITDPALKKQVGGLHRPGVGARARAPRAQRPPGRARLPDQAGREVDPDRPRRSLAVRARRRRAWP